MKVLIITYYWPPSGGPAVQRWLSFSNILAGKGIEPIILTADEKFANYPAIDKSLEKQVSPQIKVYKTRTSELYWLYKKFLGKGKAPSAGFANEGKPGVLKKLARFIRGNFMLPDGRKGWNKHALKKARELLTNEDIDLVITAGPPHSTHLIGLQLKSEYNKPWIADFHDAWTDVWYYSKLMHTTLAKKYDLSLEKQILEKADAVFTVGHLLKERLASKSAKVNADKIEVISMGYDESLFKQAANYDPNEFVITYTGTIDVNYEPEVLFKALKTIKEKFPQITYGLRFAGILAKDLKDEIGKYGLLGSLEELGYLPHEESIQLLLSATVLLLVSPKVESEEIIIPGKIYEYLAARKPVINIGSLGCDSARIISECEAGENIDRNMENELTAYLIRLSEKWLNNPNLNLINDNKNYLKYGRQQEAETVYKVINKLLST